MRLKFNRNAALAAAAAGLLISAAAAFASGETPPPSTTEGPPAAQAQEATPPAAGQKPAANDQTQPDPNEKICKIDNTTGTRVSKRVCKTRKEWEEQAKQDF